MTTKYVPIKTEVEALKITSLSIVTTATFDDGTAAIVPNTASIGDFMQVESDNSTELVAGADFLAQYQPA